MPVARVNGIDVRYSVTGSGPWLALSHSLACRLEMWDEEVRRLSRRFTVLAYDSRGHGETSSPTGPYTLDMIADDIKGLLDHVGARDVHWIGLSMGGVFGLAAALRKAPKAAKFFATLDRTNRYAVIWRVQTAATPATRAKRIATLVAMLARGEKVHG